MRTFPPCCWAKAWWPWLLLALLVISAMSDASYSKPLPASLAEHVDKLPPGTHLGFVALDKQQREVFSLHPDEPLASASSIKTSILLELFVQHADELDVTRRSDIEKIVVDPTHPAIVHFPPPTQAAIANDLRDVSIRELGKIMIDSKFADGSACSNTSYNAAANVAIALLGGPHGTTRRLHDRHPLQGGLDVRRYMLADRNVTGDNTATPRGLATVFALTVNRQLPDVPPHVTQATTSILHSKDYPDGSQRYSKGGTLHTDPVTCVESGQFRRGSSQLNYAIMVAQELRNPKSGKTQYDTLAKWTQGFFEALKQAFAEE